MAAKNITIAGFILNQKTKKGIANLKVEAWDRDIRQDDPLGSGVTDSNGRFSITLQKKRGGWNLSDRKPDIFFKVYSEDKMIHNTFDSVIWNLEHDKKNIQILIDMDTITINHTGNKKANIVFGKVTDRQNRPLRNLVVQVFDRDMRSEVLLAETVTDKEGKYEINWQHSQLTGRNRKQADISIKVSTAIKKTLLFASDMDSIRFNASPREEINITITTTIQPEVIEYDYILKEVTFLAGDLSIPDLQENEQHKDVSFLANEAEIPEEKIEHLVVAHRLQAESKIDAAFFYTLLRKNTLLKNDFIKSFHARLVIDINTEILPLLYDAALADVKTVQRDIKAAVKELIVPIRVAKEYKQNIEELQRYKQKAEDYYKNEHPQKVIDLISRFISEDKFTEMGKLFEENKNDLNTFLKKITDESFFSSKGQATDAKTSLALGELLGFDNLIIEQIKATRKISKPEKVKKLAALNKAEWKVELTRSAGKINIAGKPIDKKLIDLHASSLARKFEKQFPTVAFSAQLAREKKTIFRNQASINKFFAKHEDFDLQRSSIDLFLKEKKLNSKENESMSEELKTMQRIFKLVPHYSKTNALLNANIHSAQSIAAKGETRFVNEIAPKAGISAKEAKDIFAKAQRTNTAAILVAGELQDTIRGMNIPALEMKSLSKKLEAVSKDFPNLKSLFKLTDTCECEHCRSVYSPAAYLVEILEFLKNRRLIDPTVKAPPLPQIPESIIAKDVLFFHINKNGEKVTRRADIGEIDLSCENANTLVPYIDLVCELLEEFIAPDNGILFTGKIFDNPAAKTGKISTELFDVLKLEIPVTNEAMIYATETREGLSEPYYVRDKKAVCKITKENGKYIVKLLHQTLSSAEELAAAPEYVNQGAYDELKSSNYAFKLPFDLNHTEAKAYFNRFVISRTELMKDFQTETGPAAVQIAAEIAAEKLGLTDAERSIIVASDKDNLIDQQLYWNAPSEWEPPVVETAEPPVVDTEEPELISGNVLDYMKRVDHFLDKTGLTYKELELLLSLEFISQKHKLIIHHNYDDPNAENKTISCVTAKKDIINLDKFALDRIHRFLRLQKKTGWKFEVLDEIIMQANLGNTKLDDACLIKAADLVTLAERTGIKLYELIGFYGEIPHEIRNADATKPLFHQVFLNKAKNGFIDDRLLLPDKMDGSLILEDFKSSLATCLQLSEQDFEQIMSTKKITTFGKAPFEESNRKKFVNLSYLFAASRLMKKLKLKAEDFLILTDLTRLNISTGLNISDSPENTLAFLKAADDAKRFSLNLTEVRFMLTAPEAKNEDEEYKITKLLEKLQNDYQNNWIQNKSHYDKEMPIEEQKEILQIALSKINGIEEDDLSMFMRIIDRDWVLGIDAKEIVSNKLNGVLSPSEVIAINSKIEILDDAPGPNLSKEKNDLVETFIQSIDATIIFSNLTFDKKKNILQNCLSSITNITADDITVLMKFIESVPISLDYAKDSMVRDKLEYSDKPKNIVREGFDGENLKNRIGDLFSAPIVNVEKKQRGLLKAFFKAISVYQNHEGKISILEQALLAEFKADVELIKVVLKYAKLNGSTFLKNILISDKLIDSDITHIPPQLPVISDTAFPNQYRASRLLKKMFQSIISFKLNNTEIEWYFKHNHDLGWFEWDSIPHEPGQTPSDFSSFISFLEIIEFSKQLTPVTNPADAANPITFFTVAEMLLPNKEIKKEQFIEAFSLLTGYNKEDLDAIDSYLFPSFDITKYRKIKKWKGVFNCAQHLRKLGSTVDQVKQYIKPSLDDKDTKLLRTALKARYDEDTWLITLKEIMDAIRPQKRDALVAYVLAKNPEMKDENYLYDYFLVDVEMEACMPSSRIVQAHNAIQLFVQRCLMGLEPKAAADVNTDNGWEQWKWMKNYRVWEANRKVFLYPENWIEAELRDDKSYLFTEMENELQQNELTEFTAEEALIKYLEKLDNIAFLEVVTTWYQEDIRTMHVFGRTKGGDPAIYYYRKFEKEQYWTPWEKVELDITGDHLLAFARNNRLCLAWPIFSEDPDPNQGSKLPDQQSKIEQPVSLTKKRLKIQLAISEFANNKWQPKKVSKDGIVTDYEYTMKTLSRDHYNLIYFEFGGQVLLLTSKRTSHDTKENRIQGIFNIIGCKGYPELVPNAKRDKTPDFLPDFKDVVLGLQRYNELNHFDRDR